MARVGKYYGVRPKDAIKFAWMDAKFAVEKRFDKLQRNRVQRAASGTNVTEEAATAANHEAIVVTATENATQDTPATTYKPKKKPWEYL